ncbi:MAG: hypothetical protein AABY22_01945 [Nanoarchaeota archaeon]
MKTRKVKYEIEIETDTDKKEDILTLLLDSYMQALENHKKVSPLGKYQVTWRKIKDN